MTSALCDTDVLHFDQVHFSHEHLSERLSWLKPRIWFLVKTNTAQLQHLSKNIEL